MKVFIYCLLDENNNPIYIGKTKNPLNQRKNQHIIRLNQIVDIIELDYVENNEWEYWEKFWIGLFKSWGFNLINCNIGGGGPSYHTKETCIKMSSTPRPGTSQKLKGIKRPDVSERFKGVKFSEERCNKITESKINHECYKDPNRALKIIESNKENYKIGSERNQKISEALKGKKRTGGNKSRRPVLRIDILGNIVEEYISASEAVKIFGNKGIPNNLLNKTKLCGGFKFKYK